MAEDNKEILEDLSQQESQQTALDEPENKPEDADTVEAENGNSDNQGDYQSQFNELSAGESSELYSQQDVFAEEYADANTQVQTKKKRLLMPCTIIALCIFVLAAISGAVYMLFFNNSPVGTYMVAGQDSGTKTYFIFDEDGAAKYKIDSITFIGTYSKAAGEKVSLYIPLGYTAMQGDYNFDVSGNVFTGKKLVISTDEGGSIELTAAQLPESALSPQKDFTTDEKLIGTWRTIDDEQPLTYSFNSDGTMYMSSEAMRIDAAYTIEDSKIKTTYTAYGEENSMEEEYAFDGDTLIISGIGYSKISD